MGATASDLHLAPIRQPLAVRIPNTAEAGAHFASRSGRTWWNHVHPAAGERYESPSAKGPIGTRRRVPRLKRHQSMTNAGVDARLKCAAHAGVANEGQANTAVRMCRRSRDFGITGQAREM